MPKELLSTSLYTFRKMTCLYTINGANDPPTKYRSLIWYTWGRDTISALSGFESVDYDQFLSASNRLELSRD